MKYVGRAWLDKPAKRWVITLEPHAMMDAKRVFPKLSKSELGTVHLSDTAECARRLVWFSQLHNIEFDPESYAKARAAEFHATATMVETILGAGYVPPMFDQMAVPARDYQRVAAALTLESGALLLGDQVGVGKTGSAIAMLTDPRALPAIYVTLTALPVQVQESFKRFAPHLRTHVLKSGTPYDLTKKPYAKNGEKLPFPDVLITSWSKLKGWAEVLAALGIWKSIVFDEAHELRHPGTDRYAAALHLANSCKYKLGMTGTATFGMASQVYWIISVLKPDALGTWEEFKREWCNGETGDKPAVIDPDALGMYLRNQGLMLRRTREDVGRYLPPLQRIKQTVESDVEQLHAEESRAIQLAIAVLEVGGKGEDKMRAGAELDWRLRQSTGIGKAPHVAAFVQMLLESGERVLLFGWHKAVYAIWAEKLAQWKPAFYTGDESIPEKREMVKRFTDPTHANPTNLLIMSLRSGAGLDGLQGIEDPVSKIQQAGCSCVVMGELDWSPSIFSQCEGRVHRDGQTKPVVAYYLVSDTGSDPVISETLNLKAAQLTGINDPGAPKTTKAPDQALIKLRMKRLAAAYLAKHDPRALAKIPGGVELLSMVEPVVTATPPPAVEPGRMTPAQIRAVVTPARSDRPVTIDIAPPSPVERARAAPSKPAQLALVPEPVTAPSLPPEPAPGHEVKLAVVEAPVAIPVAAPAPVVPRRVLPPPPQPRRLGVRLPAT